MTDDRMPRLVVVDDDTQLAEELAGLFTDVGYEVAGVANEAVRASTWWTRPGPTSWSWTCAWTG